MPQSSNHGGAVAVPSTGDSRREGADVPMFAKNAAPTPDNRRALEKIVAEKFGDIERYRLAIEGSQDGIWDWDIRDNSLYLSATGPGFARGDAASEPTTGGCTG